MQGIQEGLESLSAGGIHPRTLIIDDGWQMTEVDDVYRDAKTTTATRRLGIPVLEGSTAEEFEESEQRVLASYAADKLPGGSEMSNVMPALADAGACPAPAARARVVRR